MTSRWLLVALAVLLAPRPARAQADDVAQFSKAPAVSSDTDAAAPLSDAIGPTHLPDLAAAQPGPELEQLAYFAGDWSCDGKVFAGVLSPDAKETPYKSSFKIEKDLDGFWYSAEYDQDKSKDYPGNISKFFWGYDPAAKRYLSTGVDSSGAFFTTRSLGWDDGAWVNLGEGFSDGQRIPVREVFTKKSGSEFSYQIELDMGHGFRPTAQDDCLRD